MVVDDLAVDGLSVDDLYDVSEFGRRSGTA